MEILVRQLRPGMRVRWPFFRNLQAEIPDREPLLHALFDVYSDPTRAAGSRPTNDEIRDLALKYATAAEVAPQ
jgi:hypothetical protein